MTEKTNNAEICTEISTKRMYILILKAQEKILEDNPKYFKKEILSLLGAVEQEILKLNDENNNICRDLFK
jgi:hypothetical protein